VTPSLQRRFFLPMVGISLLLLGVGGVLLDNFLTAREVKLLEDRLAESALAADAMVRRQPDALQEVLSELGRATGVRYTAITRDGTVLGDSRHDPATMEPHDTRPEIVEAYAGRRGISMRFSDTLGVRMLYVAIPTTPVMRCALPLSDVEATLWQIRRRVLLAAVVAFALAFALSYLLARSYAARIGRLGLFAQELTEGRYETGLAAESDDELGQLESRLDLLRVELRRYVGRLERDREMLAKLFEALPDAVCLFDGEEKLVATNGTAARLLRMEPGRMIGLTRSELLRHPDLTRTLDNLYGPDPAPPVEPLRVRLGDPEVALDIFFRAVPDASGEPGVLVVLHDVSRQVHLEQVRTDFISNMAHELRTPLTAIRGASETLLDDDGADPAVMRRFLATIHRHAVRLGNILADIAHLSKAESGATPPASAQTDLAEIARSVADLFRLDAERGGVTLGLNLPEGGVPLHSDAEMIESILVNLVQNAIRYTPSGGSVAIEAERTGATARFTVTDTGIGIPPKEIARVTERFYRVDPGRSREKGGTGLGLSIVKHLVTTLGGTLEIQSEHGQGTSITVKLPDLPG